MHAAGLKELKMCSAKAENCGKKEFLANAVYIQGATWTGYAHWGDMEWLLWSEK